MKKENKNKEENLLEAQQRLAEIMNDTPHMVDFNGTRFAVTRLKNGTQALICEEAAKITKQENMAFGDIMKQFAVNIPSIAKVITLALLNDKYRIFNDGSAANGYTKEFDATYNTLMWDVTNNNGIIEILMEILKMIDISFFLTSSEVVKTMRNAMTKAIPQLKS